MAAPITTTTAFATFQTKVCCKQALVTSQNNDIALCTEDGMYILEHRFGVDLTDNTQHFTKHFIPREEKVNISEHQLRLEKTGALDSNSQLEAVLDRTILPDSHTNTPYTAYSAAAWSSKYTGLYDRCILACLSNDHKLTLYYSPHREDWEKLAELSKLYNDYCGKSDTNCFSDVKESIYKTSAVRIAWSRRITVDNSEREFSLLAVAMKNGDIVLWTAEHPLVDREQLSVYTVIQPGVRLPSALSWCELNAESSCLYLAIGYMSGIVKIISVCIIEGKAPLISNVSVDDSDDLMIVSALCWKSLTPSNHILLCCKENFVLGYVLVLSGDGGVEIIRSSHCEGPHTLPATSINSASDEIVLTSMDGSTSSVRLKIVGDSLSLSCHPFSSVKHKYKLSKWIAHGGSITQNGVFFYGVYSPAQFYDHLKYKLPLAIHVIPLKEINPLELPDLVANEGNEFVLSSDVLDKLRQDLQIDSQSPEKIFKKYQAVSQNVVNLPKQVLQVWRYMLSVVLKMFPARRGEENEDTDSVDRKQIEEAIDQLSRQILFLYCSRILENLSKLSNWTEKENKVNHTMKNWLVANKYSVSRKGDKSILSGKGDNSTISRKGDNSIIPELDKCVICDERYKIGITSVECSNGHKFGLCCKTLIPCVTQPFTTCLTCGVTSLTVKTLQDFSVIQDKIQCTFCCTSLF